MSKEPVIIPRGQTFSKSMDYSALKEEGVQYSQELSGDIWTDYNEHDPGITILEQLCYAMTELGFKTHFSIEDLFYSDASSNTKKDLSKEGLFAPKEIFPCTPLTVNDFRKLIVDRIPEVRNAWILPIDKSVQGINMTGLYRVFLQLGTGREEIPEKEIIGKVRTLLSQYRNICEDIDSIDVLTPKPVSISADIEIDSNAVGESVLARIAFELSEALTPPIRFYGYSEMLEKGLDLDEIFDGPEPVHGFIDDHDLERSKLSVLNTLRKSSLIRLLSRVPGVKNLSNFEVNIEDLATSDGELIYLEDHTFPVFDENFLNPPYPDACPVKLFVGEVPYDVNFEAARHSYDSLRSRHEQRYRKPVDIPAPKITAKRNPDEIRHYFSIQHGFPECYGIGQFGIPNNVWYADSKMMHARKAYAKQLKGYLLFYEQLFANFLAQLINARKLFAIENGEAKTYFSQTLFDSIPNINSLLEGDRDEVQRQLDALMKQFDPVTRRRNRFLDHLLARFGEEFMTEAFNEFNRQATPLDDEAFGKALIRAKTEFLKDYPGISRYRGKGMDYFSGTDDPRNVAGLKKRVCLLFSLEDFSHRVLHTATQDKSISISKTAKSAANTFSFSSGSEDILAEILNHGTNKNNYHIRPSEKKKGSFSIYFKRTDETDELEVFQAGTQGECIVALNALLQRLQKINSESEGFHLVEHILLRPVAPVKYSFILDVDGVMFLKSPYIYEDRNQSRSAFIRQLIRAGINEENYEVKSSGKGKKGEFRVILKEKKGGKILASSDKFLVKESAEKRKNEIIEFLNNNRQTLKNYIEIDELLQSGAILADDPYSLQMSVVLPSWPARFQNEKLRKIMEHVVKINSPAHVKVDFHWITVKPMQEFENLYAAWMEEKSSPEPGQPLLDNLSYYMILLLKSFRNPEEEIVTSELPKLRKMFGLAGSK